MVILAVLLAVQAAPPVADSYHAVGRNAPWSMTIAGDRVTITEPGHEEISVVTRRTRNADDVRYLGGNLDVTILPGPCEAADGTRYADNVYATIGHRELLACGGARLPADSLDGTSWHFAEIGGEAVPLTGDLFRDDAYAIDFGADDFMGYGGCNRFSAAYSRSGDMLTAHAPWGRTVGRCSDAVMAREQRLLQILTAPVRVSFPDRDTLLLTGETGTIRLVRTHQTN